MDTQCLNVKGWQHKHQPVFDGLLDRNEFTDSVHCVLCRKTWTNMEEANSEKQRLALMAETADAEDLKPSA